MYDQGQLSREYHCAYVCKVPFLDGASSRERVGAQVSVSLWWCALNSCIASACLSGSSLAVALSLLRADSRSCCVVMLFLTTCSSGSNPFNARLSLLFVRTVIGSCVTF